MADKIKSTTIGGKVRTLMVGTLIALLVLAFAVWGVEDVFSQRSDRAVANVGKTEVLAAEFEVAFKRELEVMARNDGQSLSHDEAYARGVHTAVLSDLIQQSVLGVDADVLGIGVNRKLARQEVAKIDVFRDELTGEFSEQKYVNILAQNRITREEFETDVFRNLRRAQTIPAIIGGVEAPSEFAAQRYKFLTEQRKARVLTLSRDAVPAPPEPDEDTLKSFISERAVSFTAPEYRSVTMIRLETFDLTPDIDVEEDALRGAFDYKVELGDVGAPEKRSLVQIIANDEDTAKQAAELLATDQDPAVIASGLGLIEPDTYDDVVAADIIDPETSKAAFEMADGDIKVLLGSLGQWYAVKVTGITPAIVPDYEAMKEELRQELLDQYALEGLYDITAKIEDGMDEGLTFKEISEQVGLPLQSIDFINRLGETQDGVKLSGIAYIKGVAEDDILLTEIFTNDIGFETDLFETSTGGFAAIRVDDVINSELRPFEEVKEQATAMWKTLEIDTALQEKMLDVTAKAQSGTDLEALAAEIGDGAVVEDVILVRSAPSEQVGPALTVALLEANVGDVDRGAGAKPLTRQIAELTAIVSNNDGLSGQFADVLQDQASVAIRSDIQRAYQDAILAENPLVENQAKIKSVLGIDSGS
ncbi:SurA N-terminal domain-containing protein [Fretibacter rubidus]|uniref:peptidylprolyl isomerase n=1 Tax=Fretibacter rubidus TaxID=570162 RepID=UPI00352A8CAB